MPFLEHHQPQRLGAKQSDEYKPGQGQPSFDKQYVRDWLKANPDNDFLLPEEVVTKTVDKYKEAYELLTGKPFTR